MKKAKKLLAKLMVFALIFAYIPTPASDVSAASSKVNTKMYTISKKTGTYSSAFKIKVSAKKGYKVYYTTGSKLTTGKVIKSGKSKKIKISKTTTLKLYAVKKSTKITKKILKSSKVKKKTKSYKYTIASGDTATTEAATETTTTEATTETTTEASTTETSTTETDTSGDDNKTSPTTESSQNEKAMAEVQSELEQAVSTASSTTKAQTPAGSGVTVSSNAEEVDIDLAKLTTDADYRSGIITTDSVLSYTAASTDSGVTTPAVLTITGGGNYKLISTDGSGNNTAVKDIEVNVKTGSDTEDIIITLDNVTIDNSESKSANSVIGIENTFTGNAEIVLTGTNQITGPSEFPSTENKKEPAPLISFKDKNNDKTLIIKSDSAGTGSLTLSDPMSDDDSYYVGLDKNGDPTDVNPADGIMTKGTLVIESGTFNIDVNGDCIKGSGVGEYETTISDTANSDGTYTVSTSGSYTSGGVTISGGTFTLNSDMGKGISSKEGLVTIQGSSTNISIASADHGISAKNYSAQILGGTINIGTGSNTCLGDGIKAGNTVLITAGKLTIDNCYGDGIQAENISIADGTIDIKTYYEKANTTFSGNTSTENEGTGLKTEKVTEDTGSHKALKAGTKEKTFSYTTVESDSDYTAGTKYYQQASGSLTITGGTIKLNTVNSGIKYNNGNNQTVIGSPDDAIHSNNTATISGGTITIDSSDDGLSVVNSLTISDAVSLTVNTAYEGIEASNIVIGQMTGSTSAPTISVSTNDDGVNAAKKEKVTYVYDDEDEESYTKTSYKTSGNTFKVMSGTIKIFIADNETHSVTLSNKAVNGNKTTDSKTYNISSDGDGIDCNGSFLAYGGNILVVGGTSGGNSPIDKDESFVMGSGVTIFAIGNSGMAERDGTPTEVGQPYFQSSSISVSKGNTVTISSGSDSLYSYTADKSANYVFFTSPKLTSGSAYTISSGSSSVSATATTDISVSGGMNNGGTPPDGGNGGTPPDGGNGGTPPSGGNGGTPPSGGGH